jgi:hypothetical protein
MPERPMNNGIDHPLVRDYLAELDSALAGLTPQRGAELKEQVTAHLDDALPPNADDELVVSVLSRLGEPSDLVREAGGLDVGATAAKAAERARGKRKRRAAWVTVGVLVVLIAAWPAYVAAMHSVGSLQDRGASAWWYPQDSTHQSVTEAEGVVQTTIHIRSGQEQGFVVDIYNPTNWTQTVIGAVSYSEIGQANDIGTPGSPYGEIAVSRDQVRGGARALRSAHYGLPGVIPPHQSRAIRVTWVSIVCDERGGGGIQDQLDLRVRVGWITRTEVINLKQAWAVYGPSTGKYAINGPNCR